MTPSLPCLTAHASPDPVSHSDAEFNVRLRSLFPRSACPHHSPDPRHHVRRPRLSPPIHPSCHPPPPSSSSLSSSAVIPRVSGPARVRLQPLRTATRETERERKSEEEGGSSTVLSISRSYICFFPSCSLLLSIASSLLFSHPPHCLSLSPPHLPSSRVYRTCINANGTAAPAPDCDDGESRGGERQTGATAAAASDECACQQPPSIARSSASA